MYACTPIRCQADPHVSKMERQNSYDEILREVREHLGAASQDSGEDERGQALDEADNDILDARCESTSPSCYLLHHD